MKRVVSLMVIGLLLCPLLIGCDESEKKDSGSTTDALTTEALTTEAGPQLIDALNADNFINVTMEMKATIKEDDVEQPVELISVYKFIADAVEISSSSIEGGSPMVSNNPNVVAENRKNIDMFQIPFLDASKNGKFEDDREAKAYNLTGDITYRMDFSGAVMDILYSNAIVKIGENGKVTEIVAEMRITFPDMPNENSSMTVTVKFYDYGTTVIG